MRRGRTRSSCLSEGLELGKGLQELDVDRWGWVGEHGPAPFTDLKVRALREPDQAGLAEVALGPVHAIGERRLLAGGQEL